MTAAPSEAPVLRAIKLTRTFPPTAPGAQPLTLFRDLSLTVHRGELVAIVGRSGAGKSSLLHLLAGLDRATGGQIFVGDTELTRLRPDAAAALRNRAIGYVWQTHYLLPEFTALENIAMPLLAAGTPRRRALADAAEWLARVGLPGRANHRSGELSGGEQQRVSIARALITRPALLLADEPTGDLDDATAAEIFQLLQTLHRDVQLAAVMVTHNLDLAARADRTLRLTGGRLQPAEL